MSLNIISDVETPKNNSYFIESCIETFKSYTSKPLIFDSQQFGWSFLPKVYERCKAVVESKTVVCNFVTGGFVSDKMNVFWLLKKLICAASGNTNIVQKFQNQLEADWKSVVKTWKIIYTTSKMSSKEMI